MGCSVLVWNLLGPKRGQSAECVEKIVRVGKGDGIPGGE